MDGEKFDFSNLFANVSAFVKPLFMRLDNGLYVYLAKPTQMLPDQCRIHTCTVHSLHTCDFTHTSFSTPLKKLCLKKIPMHVCYVH